MAITDARSDGKALDALKDAYINFFPVRKTEPVRIAQGFIYCEVSKRAPHKKPILAE